MSQEEEEELVFRERAEAAPKLDLEQCIFSGTRHKDFGGALSHMGGDTTDSGAAQLLAAYDERPDGKLDVSEFRKLVSDLGVKFA